MEFYQDLIPKAKKFSKLGTVLITLLVVILLSAQIYVNINSNISSISYFNIILWTIWFILYLMQVYTGRRIESFFGKAYIHITAELLKLKTSVFKKEKTIFWKDLNRLSMKPTYIKVTDKNGKKISIDFKNLEYQAVKDLKDLVKNLIDNGIIKGA